MHPLFELQQDFLHAVVNREFNKVNEKVSPGKIGTQKQLEIYANNIQANLTSALEAVYPVIQRLIGEEFFKQIAHDYISRYPSLSGDIHDFGAYLPQLLISSRGLEQHSYLFDTARLEWLIHESFHSAEGMSLSLDKLATVSVDDYSRLKFTLHPACRLLTSIYPIRRIWEINQPDYEKEDSVHLNEGGVYLLLCRPGFMVELIDLRLVEYSFLSAISAGVSFSEATEQALQIEADFNLGLFLQTMLEKNVIVDFELEEAI